jgi:energy-coupling factor transport system substrate-specific component
VSWPLASFLVVGVVLALGWLAYERRRPSARMVAVVGTLAAVAALGRDAFVALPDVKPITAMTLVVGYALGPLPGFAVGAMGMLMSNFLLGQGPYTPWQMAAWGCVGLFGALLGRLSARHMGRVPLALCCAIAALAAKEVMNVYTWTIGASHTPAALLTVAGTGLPFDLTDTVASFLFGLAFAPELARLLADARADGHSLGTRPRARAPGGPNGARLRRYGRTCIRGIAVPGALLPDRRPEQRRRLRRREGAELQRAVHRLGGDGPRRRRPRPGGRKSWRALGARLAARRSLDPERPRRRRAHDPRRARVRGLCVLVRRARPRRRSAACARARQLLRAPGQPHRVRDLRAARGRSFGRLSPRSAKRPAGSSASRSSDGGFGFGEHGSPSDVDDTGAALQALADAGARNKRVLAAAANYLIRAQNLDGGFPQQPGGESNAQSTAWAIQGLIAAGAASAATQSLARLGAPPRQPCG